MFRRGAEQLGDWRQWEVAQGRGGRRAAAQAHDGLRRAGVDLAASFWLHCAWPVLRERASCCFKT